MGGWGEVYPGWVGGWVAGWAIPGTPTQPSQDPYLVIYSLRALPTAK